MTGGRQERILPATKYTNEEADNTVISAKLPLQTDGRDIHREMAVNSNSIEYQEAQ